MKDNTIVLQAKEFVAALFKERLSKKLVYHNFRHTVDTATEARNLGEALQLPDNDLQDLLLAAWFHDTGYITTYSGHEEESVRFATDWLEGQGYPAERIQVIAGMIMATKQGNQPEGLLQEVLVDADLSNIGRKTFFATAELLRVEWEIFMDRFYDEREWAQFQMDFLLSTTFRTSVAQRNFAAQLGLNIQDQRNSLNKEVKKQKKSNKKSRETLAQPKRGIETMFRNTYRTHLNLSAIADNKANMMISLNAIIISVIITYLSAQSSVIGSGFAQTRTVIIPIGMLLFTTLGSIVFAIISAQPDVTSFAMSEKKIVNRNVNLLFFGNFTKITLDDFQKGIHEIMRDKSALYTNMITDIYYLGEVLDRKYKKLRVSYTIFMVGLVCTVIAFGISILTSNS